MKAQMKKSMLIVLFFNAASIYALTVFVNNLTPTGFCPLALGIFLWVISPLNIACGSVLWEGKSWRFFFITASYQLVSLVALSYILYYLKP